MVRNGMISTAIISVINRSNFLLLDPSGRHCAVKRNNICIFFIPKLTKRLNNGWILIASGGKSHFSLEPAHLHQFLTLDSNMAPKKQKLLFLVSKQWLDLLISSFSRFLFGAVFPDQDVWHSNVGWDFQSILLNLVWRWDHNFCIWRTLLPSQNNAKLNLYQSC